MGSSTPRPESSTKAERKFEKKVQFYAKVRDTVASLGAKKAISKKKRLRSREKKLKPYDLSALSEFLPEFKVSKQPTPEFKLNCKSRKELIIKEGNQLGTVLRHPAFQSDPLNAIHQHLQSTQPVTNENPVKKKKSKKEKKKSKKGKKKAVPDIQSMEI